MLPFFKRAFGLFVLTVVLGASSTGARAANVSPYFSPGVLPPTVLAPPPEPDSMEEQAQLNTVIALQMGVSDQDLAAMRDEQRLRPEHVTAPLGRDFNRARLPITFNMLDRAQASVSQVVEADKKYWGTTRPYLVDPRVELRVDPIDNSPAYPSGHTAASALVAEIVALLVPERGADVRDAADSIAQHRIQAGVHYQADIEGGKKLAFLAFGVLMSNNAFLTDLRAAQKEVDVMMPVIRKTMPKPEKADDNSTSPPMLDFSGAFDQAPGMSPIEDRTTPR